MRALVAFGLLGSMPMVSDASTTSRSVGGSLSATSGGAFYWPPGEGIVLAAGFALLGPSIAVARGVTVAISAATTVLTALIAREVAGDRAARTAGWMWAGYAPSVLLSGQPCAQHLAALCLAAVAYHGMRAARGRRLADFVATGLALGLGVLTRPSMASVAFVVVAAWALVALANRRRGGPWPRERRLRRASRSRACCRPARTTRASGAGWTVSTNNERNLFLGNNPYTPDYKTSHLGQRPLDELGLETRSYLESFYARGDSRSAMQRAAIVYMVQHPVRTSRRTLNRAMSFWGFDYLASREIQKWAGAEQEAGATRRAAYRPPRCLSWAGGRRLSRGGQLVAATSFVSPGGRGGGSPGAAIAAAGTHGEATAAGTQEQSSRRPAPAEP